MIVNRSLFHQRALLCFDVFLQNRANFFAKLQYVVLVLYLQCTQKTFLGFRVPDISNGACLSRATVLSV